MLTVLPEICKGAAEIESHPDKYTDTKRMDVNLKEVHVLLGALSDGDVLLPVQLEIKEYKQVGREKNKLYLTVTLKKRKQGSCHGPGLMCSLASIVLLLPLSM